MMRTCENCGAKLVRGATSCPECGVFAGKTDDLGKPVPKRSHKAFVFALAVLAILGALLALWMRDPQMFTRLLPQSETASAPAQAEAPVRVVRDRPGGARRGAGAAINEAEAVRLLRRHLTEVQPDCLVIMSVGYRDGGYLFTAVNRCEGTRLGRYRVDGDTRKVTRSTNQR